jgi:hypothetical protein
MAPIHFRLFKSTRIHLGLIIWDLRILTYTSPVLHLRRKLIKNIATLGFHENIQMENFSLLNSAKRIASPPFNPVPD